MVEGRCDSAVGTCKDRGGDSGFRLVVVPLLEATSERSCSSESSLDDDVIDKDSSRSAFIVLATSRSDAPELKSAISDDTEFDSSFLLMSGRLGTDATAVALPGFALLFFAVLSEDDTDGEEHEPTPRAALSFEDADPA